MQKENTGQIESMDRQSMIDKIYEKIADKTLSFGCMIKIKGKEYYEKIIEGPNPLGESRTLYNIIKKEHCDKIIGHPVSLARVLYHLGYDYYYNLGFIRMPYNTNIMIPRKLLTDSGEEAMLDNQSDETIRAILGLLSE